MTNLPDKTPPHGGDVYHLARTLGVELADLLDFSANINPLGFPPGLPVAVQEALAEIVHYPDRRCLELRRDLAAYHDLTPEQILVGNGSTELIYLVARALRPRRGLIVAPAFSEYEHALNLARVPVDFPSHRGGRTILPSSEVPDAPGRRPGLPGQSRQPQRGPAGPGAVPAGWRPVEAAGAYLLLDEAFVDFVEEASLKIHLGRFPRLLILRSFTKFFGIPGMRLGYLLARAGTDGALVRGAGALVGEHPGPGHGAGLPGRPGVHQPDPDPDPREREFLLDRLAALPGLTVFPSAVNYLLVKLTRPGDDRGALRERMLAHRVVIRDASNFRGLDERFFRIAVRRREENERLLAALEQCLRIEDRLEGHGYHKCPRYGNRDESWPAWGATAGT